MEKKTYTPQPAETGKVIVPETLLSLSEELAKNTHEVWAAGRISAGWTWGPTRNDGFKQTPCLVPYEEMDDGEKEYDRRTSMETIKLILSLGYDIIKGKKCKL